MSNLQNYAETELSKISDRSEEQELINKCILDIVKLFSEQGHSGFSAEYVTNAVQKLMKFKPLTPLTGEDDEWVSHNSNGNVVYQNNRCYSVFKDESGFCYDLDAVTFYHPGEKFSFTNGNRVRDYFKEQGSIAFPYVPVLEPKWIEVPQDEED